MKTKGKEQKIQNILNSYKRGDLSIGEVAETLEMTYFEAREWINKQGIIQDYPKEVNT